MLAAFSVLVWIVAWRLVPPLDAHVAGSVRRNPVAQLRAIFGVPNHLRAFAFMIALTASAFLIVPFIAAYNVANVGLLETELPYIYFAGGITTLFTAQLIGWLADRYGKKRIFTILAFISIVPIVVMTHLPKLSLAPVIVVTMLFFVFVPGRFGPATALVTGSVAPRLRGSFMSFSGAVQQLGAGAASFAAGLVIGRAADGSLTHYDWAGWGAVAATLVAVVLARGIRIVPDGSRAPIRMPGRIATLFGRRPRPRVTSTDPASLSIPMIIPSLLDTDLYKFTMMQVVQHHFAEAQVEYRFKCRNANIDLSPYVAEIEDEIRALCELRFAQRELDYLRRWRFFKSDFVDLLGLFHLEQRFIKVTRMPESPRRDRHHDQGAVAAHDPVRSAGARDRVGGLLPQYRSPSPTSRKGGGAWRRRSRRRTRCRAPISGSPTTERGGAFRAPGRTRSSGRSSGT